MKKTIKSLFLSGISILLCLSMLAGSTFAWFTDEVTSGNNVIMAGNLDIEMHWTKDLENGTWIDAEDANAEPVFNYDKWEPGYSEVRYIKIKTKRNDSNHIFIKTVRQKRFFKRKRDETHNFINRRGRKL